MKTNYFLVFASVWLLAIFKGLGYAGDSPPMPVGMQKIIKKAAPRFTYKVMNSYPHDHDAWTQGLVYHQGFIYEGTGINAKSSLRKVEIKSGRIMQQYKMADLYYGEGIVIFENRLYQLTWLSGICFEYELQSFSRLRTFNYQTQGWGLTTDGENLIMSDGTPALYFRSPDDFSVQKIIIVHDDSSKIGKLNELEFIDGEIWANVWKTDMIVKISPASGLVTGVIDLSGLLDDRLKTPDTNVLNGIAYDADQDRIFVTGKRWPKLFEIEIIPTR